MGKNILNISDNSYGEYAKHLDILSIEGFENLIKELERESVHRSLSGLLEYDCLKLIAKTLSSFDVIQFDNMCIPMMKVSDWEKLRQNIDPNMTERECIRWLFNGMITGVHNIIDEDIRYGNDCDFYKNLRDFLCTLVVEE